jgi:hypothetical protein
MNERSIKSKDEIMTKNVSTPATVIVETREELGVVPERTAANDSVRARSSFGKTNYYIDPTRARLAKGPQQMMDLVKWMIENDVTSPAKALQGSVIGTKAITDGFVKTNKLTGPVIFAYYARRMEKEQGMVLLNVVHAKTGKVMA